jgi:hypothetical protein
MDHSYGQLVVFAECDSPISMVHYARGKESNNSSHLASGAGAVWSPAP